MEVFGIILGIIGVLLSIILWLYTPEKIRKFLGLKHKDHEKFKGHEDHKADEEDPPHGKLLRKAEAGDDIAQCELGIMYMNDDRVPMDYDIGLAWLKKSAEQNNLRAVNFLGQSYAHGWGVEQNDEKAAELFKKAAGEGYADAQFNLGIAYAHGAGVEYDDRKALEWLRKAADQGIWEAEDVIWRILHFSDLDEE